MSFEVWDGRKMHVLAVGGANVMGKGVVSVAAAVGGEASLGHSYSSWLDEPLTC